MNIAVRHRGPDGDHFILDGDLALGHRRLSIIDISEKGKQPMLKEAVWISYNGEIYNYVELRVELESLGHTFNSNSDTEVILSSWRQWGTECFKKFNGMWGFILFDTQKQKVIICRDHFGIKPVLYTSVDGYFAAGSEIKQFLPLPGFIPRLNHKVTYKFLRTGLLNYSTDTFFEGVFTLGAGHYLEYDLTTHNFAIHEWYNLKKNIEKQNVDFETAKSTVYDLFKDSVRLRMRSDVRIGSCLSGGIDSSGIVATVRDGGLYRSDFATFTSVYTEKSCDESIYSNAMEMHCGFEGFKTHPKLENLIESNDLDTMLYHLEQPISSASHYSEYKVFELAGIKNARVMLDGQGSDEYFWGYDEFFNLRISDLLKKMKLISIIKLLKEKSIHHEGSILEILIGYCRALLYYPFVTFLKARLGKDRPTWMNEGWYQSSKKANSTGLSSCEALSEEQMIISSLPFQLHSEDRNSMRFSVEARTPFLDPNLVEFVMGLPGEYKVQHGYSKYILRQALQNLPDFVRYRKHKLGFPAPDESWLHRDQEAISKELLNAVNETSFFNTTLLKRYHNFLKGHVQYEPIYIRAITLNRFIKIFNMQL